MNVNDALLAVSGVLGGNSGGGGGGVILTPKTITENGIYLPQDDGVDGYDAVTVDVAGGPTYTEISAITIRNDSSNGYNNRILFNPTVAIKKFDIKYKLIGGNVIDTNDIVLAKVSYYGTSGISPTTPFFSYKSSVGVSSIVKSVDANRYAHATGTFDTAISGAFVGIGAWTDSTYSKTNAFAYVKLYDESDNLVFDAIPVEDGYNRPALYDKVTKQLYYTFTGGGMESGEVVS